MSEGGRRGRIDLGPGGEFDVIREVLAGAREPGEGVRIGPGDDALVLEGGVVVSCDISVEDVHFRRDWLDLEEIGYRATAAALSDLAAMAAGVEGALLSVAAPSEAARETVTALTRGAGSALEDVGGALLGGDLSASPGPLVVDVVALGRAERPVSRAGARPGQRVWVTGSLGGAAGAARRWARGRAPSGGLRDAFARPRPRTREALWLSEREVLRSLIDVSDGLAGDAGHLAAAGGVGIVLEWEAVPLHPELEGALEGARDEAVELALTGGEDFELLFTAEAGAVEPLADEFAERFGVALTPVGEVTGGRGVSLRRGGEEVSLERRGHDHFPMDGAGSTP